jgi:hypothetical protein
MAGRLPMSSSSSVPESAARVKAWVMCLKMKNEWTPHVLVFRNIYTLSTRTVTVRVGHTTEWRTWGGVAVQADCACERFAGC